MSESTEKASSDHLLYQTCKINPAEGIRLLEIAPGAAEKPINCKLVPVVLGGDVRYAALSYVWGSPR